jgi:acetylglutamate kinase
MKTTTQHFLSPQQASVLLDPVMGHVRTAPGPATLTDQLVSVRRQKAVATLLEAMPYVSRFWGTTIVVKYGGMTMKSPRLHEQLARDMVLLRLIGMRPIVVHEGQSEADLAHLIRRYEASAVRVAGVKPKALAYLAQHAVPVVGSARDVGMTLRGAGDGHAKVTVDTDTVAGEIAAATVAEKLIFLCDVVGICEDQGSDADPISECDLAHLGALQAAGGIGDGMITKVHAVRRALEAGVGSAHVIDGRVEHAVLLEILTDSGCGTKVTL